MRQTQHTQVASQQAVHIAFYAGITTTAILAGMIAYQFFTAIW